MIINDILCSCCTILLFAILVDANKFLYTLQPFRQLKHTIGWFSYEAPPSGWEKVLTIV